MEKVDGTRWLLIYKKINNFCKSIKTKDRSINDLYLKMSTKSPAFNLTRADFEIGMLKLKKKPALKLKADCLGYFLKGNDYHKFCKEQVYVTREFWTEITGAVGPLVSDKVSFKEKDVQSNGFFKLLPANWIDMTKSDRAEFAQKIQHEEFREYVFNIDPEIKNLISKIKKPAKFKMYVNLFQFPANRYSTESKNLLKCFIDNLNTLGRANLQYVECTSPHIIEIREIR